MGLEGHVEAITEPWGVLDVPGESETQWGKRRVWPGHGERASSGGP